MGQLMPHGSSSKIRSVAVTGSLEDCFALVQGVSGGNPDLQPETSTQWNFGVVWEPLRELSLGLDYWNIEQRGVISPLEPDNILRFPERFGSRLIRGPVDDPESAGANRRYRHIADQPRYDEDIRCRRVARMDSAVCCVRQLSTGPARHLCA